MLASSKMERCGFGLSLFLFVASGFASDAPQPPIPQATAKGKFRAYDVVDSQLGGLWVNRLTIPEDWKATSRVAWNINAYYMPVRGSIRIAAPDESSWVEFFPAEMFVWLDPAHDRGPVGKFDASGSIHHPNVTLPQALVRYVVARNRGNVSNLHLLGYRPVNELPKSFPHLYPNGGPPGGTGICMRMSYDLAGTPVDEEFYAFMPKTDVIQAPPSAVEYHSYLFLVHSLGAKSGRLESVRPLLGSIATSIDINPAWVERFQQIHQQQLQRVSQNIAQGWASINAAKQMSAQAHASSEALIHRIDAGLAQSQTQQAASRASSAAVSSQSSGSGTDGFDQYVRGTEHMQDQYGVVSDQYTDYNYHWTDGFGRFVHTDDPNLDPNRYLNGNYQQMTPAR
ncbi:MAG: hypothetical protein ACLQVY_30480 [Limisphaerales bacterium]